MIKVFHLFTFLSVIESLSKLMNVVLVRSVLNDYSFLFFSVETGRGMICAVAAVRAS